MFNKYLKGCLIAVFVLVFSTLHAQQTMLSVPMKLSGITRKPVSVVIQNTAGSQFSLFALDASQMVTVLFNDKMEVQQQHSFKKPFRLSDRILGGFNHGSAYTLFSATGNNEFAYFTIDYATGQNRTEKISLQFPEEKLLETLEMNEKFYFVTVIKEKSHLNVYEFSSGNSCRKIEFPLPYCADLYKALTESGRRLVKTPVKVEKIDERVPSSLGMTQSPCKLYTIDNKIVLTLDRYIGKTELIEMDMIGRQAKYRMITHKFEDKQIPMVSNSVIHRDKIYQVYANEGYFHLAITSLADESVVAGYGFNQEDTISFRNTPIIQEGGSSFMAAGDTREITTARQLLRKMYNSTIAITVNETQAGQLDLTIGSFKEIREGSAPIGTMEGGTFSYMYTSYQTSTWTKSAFFRSLLDASSFSHIQGKPHRHIFATVKIYEDKILQRTPDAVTLFRIGNDYIYGFYDAEKITYQFMKF